MSVEQYDPQAKPKQTTTLETPKKVLAAQAAESAKYAAKTTKKGEENAARIGFISLGCPSVA